MPNLNSPIHDFIWKYCAFLILSVEKIICWNCNAEIIQYYNQNYKGKRGRCPICGVDFPLE